MTTERKTHPRAPGPVLVSACLLGVRCRFDGGSKPAEGLLAKLGDAAIVPVCPEQLGGLPTPRPRHERVGDRVVSEHGVDATEAFRRGAVEAIRLLEATGASWAVLKARSPSCGRDLIYDGSFSGRIVAGHGMLAEMLLARGIDVCTEQEMCGA